MVFFTAVTFAALTSLINLFEAPVATLQELFHLSRPVAVALGGPGSVLSWAIVGVRAKKPSRGLVFSFPLLYLCGRWVAFRCGLQWPGGSPQMIIIKAWIYGKQH